MTHDVAIVGGGIAGLAAAWHLRHRDVVLLEAGDRLGGRMRSDPCGDYWLNYGAHLFPAPGSLVDTMVRECGLETVPVTGCMMGLAVGSTLLDRGRVETYPFRLPLSLRDRMAFARAGVRVRRAVAGYHGDGFEDDRTFGEFLGPLPPAVRAIFSCAAHRATAELDELSAGCGIGLFALVWGGRRSLIARNLLGGTGALPQALGRELGERARTACRVRAVRPDGDDLVVQHDGGGLSARHVIVAAPAPYAAPLVAPVAERAAAMLSQLTYGAFVSVAIETSETAAMPYDDVYAMATPGRVFDLFTNQANALRGGPRRPGGSLMLFAGAHGAAALMHEGDEAIVERFLADLHELYPQTRGVIAGAKVRRWELGNVYARPGGARVQGLESPSENLHLAGDYFAELGNIEAAARSGLAAAERVDARIREVTHV
jgi:oxygen-dependent protoporphyrinogen oxidase